MDQSAVGNGSVGSGPSEKEKKKEKGKKKKPQANLASLSTVKCVPLCQVIIYLITKSVVPFRLSSLKLEIRF